MSSIKVHKSIPEREPFAPLVRQILSALGEDPNRDGLLKTPSRVEAAYRWLTRGYDLSVEDVVGDAVFEENHESMILVRDIELYSMCEHHMLPFFGRAHVAYIPDGRIIGLSKLPRLVEEDPKGISASVLMQVEAKLRAAISSRAVNAALTVAVRHYEQKRDLLGLHGYKKFAAQLAGYMM